MNKTRMRLSLSAILLYLPLTVFALAPIKSIVIFGDSLSDNGNTTHLLKSLRQEVDPAFLVRPAKVFILNQIDTIGENYGIPQFMLEIAKDTVTNYLDYDFAPLLASVINVVRTVPLLPKEPYWQSRFSNGPVWIEYLSTMLGVDNQNMKIMNNKAFSGSWAQTFDHRLSFWNFVKNPLTSVKNLIVGKLIPPSLELTIQAFLIENPKIDTDSLYILFSGGNDYLNIFQFGAMEPEEIEGYIDNVIASIENSMNQLVHSGAKKMVIMGMPHIGDSPFIVKKGTSDIHNYMSDRHNQHLKDKLVSWKEKYPRVEFIYIDLVSYFEKLRLDPEAYGISYLDTPCIDADIFDMRTLKNAPFAKNIVLEYVQAVAESTALSGNICENPNSHLFWDAVHPSTRAHHWMAREVCEDLKAAGYTADCKPPVIN